MTVCAFCGRDNEAGADFCVDCGKSLAGKPIPFQAAAVATAERHAPPAPSHACPFCGVTSPGPVPFCPHCGRRLTAPGSGPSCGRCGSPVGAAAHFCATCGAPTNPAPQPVSRPSGGPSPRPSGTPIALALLDDSGGVLDRLERRGDVTIGRLEGDLTFPDDPFLSPLHAKLSWEGEQLVVRDLGSRNGTWVFLEAPHRLLDGDLLLIGSQVIRFRRLGYPGPHAPEADATKRMGSLTPSADIASLTQLRSDGSVRDVIQLSPGRDVQIGRERGDWIFPYDPAMSGAHATVRSEDADFVVLDARSRNGVALAARGDVPLRHLSRILLGNKVLRVELPPR
jgi:pSer/pThr/pTyr-binding forkhead associated (FHA) protein